MMTTRRRMMPTMMHMRIFMSFHHIYKASSAVIVQLYACKSHTCFLTRFAPRLKPCAETARLSVLSWRESRCSPRCETLLMFSRITPTVSSICYNLICQSFRDQDSLHLVVMLADLAGHALVARCEASRPVCLPGSDKYAEFTERPGGSARKREAAYRLERSSARVAIACRCAGGASSSWNVRVVGLFAIGRHDGL